MMTLSEPEAGLHDRLALLAGGRLRRRQRTLEGTLDWSYGLLDEDEQPVLRSLGVFVDGFDQDAASAAAGMPRAAVFAAVEALTSRSMVVRVDSARRARFGLLETVRARVEGVRPATDQAAAWALTSGEPRGDATVLALSFELIIAHHERSLVDDGLGGMPPLPSAAPSPGGKPHERRGHVT